MLGLGTHERCILIRRHSREKGVLRKSPRWVLGVCVCVQDEGFKRPLNMLCLNARIVHTPHTTTARLQVGRLFILFFIDVGSG